MPKSQNEIRKAITESLAQGMAGKLDDEKIDEILLSIETMPAAFDAGGYIVSGYFAVHISLTGKGPPGIGEGPLPNPIGPFFSANAFGATTPGYSFLSGTVHTDDYEALIANTHYWLFSVVGAEPYITFYDAGNNIRGYFKGTEIGTIVLGLVGGLGVWSTVASANIPLPTEISFEFANFDVTHSLWGTGDNGKHRWGYPPGGAYLQVSDPISSSEPGYLHIVVTAALPSWGASEDLAFITRYRLDDEEKTHGVFSAMRIGGKTKPWSTVTPISGTNIPLPTEVDFEGADFDVPNLYGTGNNGTHHWGWKYGANLVVSKPTRNPERTHWQITVTATGPTPTTGENLAFISRYKLKDGTPGVFAAMWVA